MRTSKTPTCRLIQYHSANLKFDGAASLQACIVKFVAGIRGDRQNPVAEKQILSWFKGTDAEFVREQLGVVCNDGRVRICMRSLSSRRRANGGYVYEVMK